MSKLDKLMLKRDELKLRIQEERKRDASRRQRSFMRRARAAGLLTLSEAEMEGVFERMTSDIAEAAAPAPNTEPAE